MIFADHNFTENFCSASGNQDGFMLNEIVIDELARQIVENKNDVVSLLRRHGVNVSLNDNNKTISLATTREIAKGNKDISKTIANQIMSNRFEKEVFHKFNGTRNSRSKNKGADGVAEANTAAEDEKKKLIDWGSIWSGTKDVASELVNDEVIRESASTYLSDLLNRAFNNSSPTQTNNNQNQLNERLLVNQTRQSSQVSVKGVAIFTGIVVVAGVLTYLIVKAKRNAE